MCSQLIGRGHHFVLTRWKWKPKWTQPVHSADREIAVSLCVPTCSVVFMNCLCSSTHTVYVYAFICLYFHRNTVQRMNIDTWVYIWIFIDELDHIDVVILGHFEKVGCCNENKLIGDIPTTINPEFSTMSIVGYRGMGKQ